jgi:hypothetical protein
MRWIHGRWLLAWLVCSWPAAVTLAQPELAARPVPPPTVAQVLSDGGWRALTWYLLTRDDREEVYVRDVGLDPRTAAALAEYGTRAVSAYAAHDASLKARFCPRLANVTTGSELGATMREWMPLGQQELTRLLAGAFEMLSDEDSRRITRHLGQLSQTAVFFDDYSVDYEAFTPARVATVVAGACSPDA